MNYQTPTAGLQGLTAEDAARLIGKKTGQVPAVRDLWYWAWPQTFPSTAGPFGGIGGQAMSVFTLEAWSDGRAAVVFCQGRTLQVNDRWTPGEYSRRGG